MDLLTQGLVGALLAHSAARRQESRPAAVVGFASGLLADADVLIQSTSDPLLVLEYHRHFTHALLFIPLGALLATLLLWPGLRRTLPLGRLYLFALLGFSFSGLLDACTSYGTHLFWPFSAERVAWRIISIVDPLFTLGLLFALLLALRRRAAAVARFGLLFAAAYLLVGVVQQQRAAAVAADLAAARGHRVERALVKPTLGNLLLWRSIYEADGRFHVDAVRVGLFTAPRVFEGESIARFNRDEADQVAPPGTQLHADIVRFDGFSDGYLARFPGRTDVLGDVRYANLPTSVTPLWGIQLPADGPDRHAEYRLYRDLSPGIRQRFLAMLFPDS